MPAINLTNNTTLNVAASSEDANATLIRYLLSVLTFTTPRQMNRSVPAVAGLLYRGMKALRNDLGQAW